jgi:hypothetical protein
VLVLTLMLLLGTADAATTRSAARAQDLEQAVRLPLAGVREHLRAFQEIADRNGGTRASGTAGYDASARYVAARMRAAGYRVRFQELSFPFVADRTPPALRTFGAGEWTFRTGRVSRRAEPVRARLAAGAPASLEGA